MKPIRGRSLPLSPHRTMVCDLMHFAQKIPTIPVQRKMRLERLVVARQECTPRPSWCALFAHAFAKVAERMPQLRRAYMSFPTPHLYEHPISIAIVPVERRVEDETVLAFARVFEPAKRRLAALDRYLKWFARPGQKSMTSARVALFISRLWRPVRLAIWWLILNVSGNRRVRSFGTFSVSVYSALGAESLHPLSCSTFVLNYGPIDEHGKVDVRIIYDHRVLDGAMVARALAALEEELTGPTVENLLATCHSALAPRESEIEPVDSMRPVKAPA